MRTMSKKCVKNITGVMAAFFAVVTVLCLNGCQKSPINGKLDGMWQVMSVVPEPEVKPYEANIYYNFYMHTVQLSVAVQGVWTSGNMTYDGESLTMDFPYVSNQTHLDRLGQYGIGSNPVTFAVVELTGKRLVLRDGDTVVTMRKF